MNEFRQLSSHLTCVCIWFAFSVTTYGQGASQSSTDATFEQLLKSMQARQPALEKLLVEKVIGETQKGFVAAAVVAADITADEQKVITEENADRKKAYDTMALITGRPADQMAKERYAQRMKLLPKNILRERTDPGGKVIWGDGLSDTERRAGYSLAFVRPPPGRVLTDQVFDIAVEVFDADKQPVASDAAMSDPAHPVLITLKSLSGTPIDGAKEMPLVAGKAHWQVSISKRDKAVTLVAEAADKGSDFAGLIAKSSPFAVERAPISADKAGAELEKIKKFLTIALNLPDSPLRNEHIISAAEQLDSFITDIKDNTMDQPVLQPMLTEAQALRAKLP